MLKKNSFRKISGSHLLLLFCGFTGAVHEPIFVYRVVVGEIVATGKGPSKKKAKHNAAQEALEKIREVVASAAGQDMSQVRVD